MDMEVGLVAVISVFGTMLVFIFANVLSLNRNMVSKNEIQDLRTEIRDGFNNLENKMEQKFKHVGNKFNDLKNKFENRCNDLENKMSKLSDNTDKKIDNLHQKTDNVLLAFAFDKKPEPKQNKNNRLGSLPKYSVEKQFETLNTKKPSSKQFIDWIKMVFKKTFIILV